MWKTVAFYGIAAVVFGALTIGSMEYTSQFSVDNAGVKSSYSKQKTSGHLGLSNDWAKR